MSYNLSASHCRKPFRQKCVCYKIKNTNKGCTDCPTCYDCTHKTYGEPEPTEKCHYIVEVEE